MQVYKNYKVLSYSPIKKEKIETLILAKSDNDAIKKAEEFTLNARHFLHKVKRCINPEISATIYTNENFKIY